MAPTDSLEQRLKRLALADGASAVGIAREQTPTAKALEFRMRHDALQ
jgi:hypothetical protein